MLKGQNANRNHPRPPTRQLRQLKRLLLRRLRRIVLPRGIARDMTRAIARISTTRMPRAPTLRRLSRSMLLTLRRPHQLRGLSLVIDRGHRVLPRSHPIFLASPIADKPCAKFLSPLGTAAAVAIFNYANPACSTGGTPEGEANMELQLPKAVNTTAIAERSAKCVFCRNAMLLAEAMRSLGVCKLCSLEIAEFGWRTVYDRDLNIGEIPANLRVAYKL